MIIQKVSGKTISHNGETYVCDQKTKDWYIRVPDARYNGEKGVWQPINKLHVPPEVLKQV